MWGESGIFILETVTLRGDIFLTSHGLRNSFVWEVRLTTFLKVFLLRNGNRFLAEKGDFLFNEKSGRFHWGARAKRGRIKKKWGRRQSYFLFLNRFRNATFLPSHWIENGLRHKVAERQTWSTLSGSWSCFMGASIDNTFCFPGLRSRSLFALNDLSNVR